MNGDLPAHDGAVNDGYDTISPWNLAKNTLTVGNAADALDGDDRNLVNAKTHSTSSWGRSMTAG